MKPLHIAAALVMVSLWGVNFVVAKVAVGMAPPLFTLALRSLLTAAVLIGLAPVPRAQMRDIAVLSVVVGGLHFGLMFSGLAGVDAAVAAIVAQLGTPFSALFAWLILDDRFGWKRTGGLVAAFAGVADLAGEPKTASCLPHLLMVVGAALTWGLGNVQTKRIGAINVFSLLAYMNLFAAP